VSTIFLLSPANSAGERMRLVLRPQAKFDLAVRLRSRTGAPLGEVFSFCSGLYFRGKLAYSNAFGRALVIAPGRGLLPATTIVKKRDIVAMGKIPVDLAVKRYRDPLLRDARALLAELNPRDRVVLLGSIASPKYTTLLLEVFGDRLQFPPAFVGRGDLSRGGLMLRSAREKTELDFAPVSGAKVRGARPPRLPKIPPAR
jgi:hypothetical protein